MILFVGAALACLLAPGESSLAMYMLTSAQLLAHHYSCFGVLASAQAGPRAALSRTVDCINSLKAQHNSCITAVRSVKAGSCLSMPELTLHIAQPASAHVLTNALRRITRH